MAPADVIDILQCPLCKLNGSGVASIFRRAIHSCEHCGATLPCDACLSDPGGDTMDLSKCASCMLEIRQPPPRSRIAERMVDTLRWACLHDGCGETMRHKDMCAHVRNCPFKPFTCPFPGCDFKGPMREHEAHVKSVHAYVQVDDRARAYTRDKFVTLGGAFSRDVEGMKGLEMRSVAIFAGPWYVALVHLVAWRRRSLREKHYRRVVVPFLLAPADPWGDVPSRSMAGGLPAELDHFCVQTTMTRPNGYSVAKQTVTLRMDDVAHFESLATLPKMLGSLQTLSRSTKPIAFAEIGIGDSNLLETSYPPCMGSMEELRRVPASTIADPSLLRHDLLHVLFEANPTVEGLGIHRIVVDDSHPESWTVHVKLSFLDKHITRLRGMDV